MKRDERNEFNYIKRTLRDHMEHGLELKHGTLLSIRIDAGAEYKKALHEYYTELGFHPANIITDNRLFDGKERIIYIYGLTYELDGEERPWTELYTAAEKAAFEKALA